MCWVDGEECELSFGAVEDVEEEPEEGEEGDDGREVAEEEEDPRTVHLTLQRPVLQPQSHTQHSRHCTQLIPKVYEQNTNKLNIFSQRTKQSC